MTQLCLFIFVLDLSIKKTDFDIKVTEIDGKSPDVRSLVTKSALIVVENKIPDASSLVKKRCFNSC